LRGDMTVQNFFGLNVKGPKVQSGDSTVQLYQGARFLDWDIDGGATVDLGMNVALDVGKLTAGDTNYALRSKADVFLPAVAPTIIYEGTVTTEQGASVIDSAQTWPTTQADILSTDWAGHTIYNVTQDVTATITGASGQINYIGTDITDPGDYWVLGDTYQVKSATPNEDSASIYLGGDDFNGRTVRIYYDGTDDVLDLSGAEVRATDGLIAPDDVPVTFGTGADASIYYDETTNDELRIDGADVAIEGDLTAESDLLLEARLVVSTEDVTCGDGTNTCAYSADVVTTRLTSDDDEDGADVVTVTDGLDGQRRTFVFSVDSGDDVTIDVSTNGNGTDTTMTAAGQSVTYEYDSNTDTWWIIASN